MAIYNIHVTDIKEVITCFCLRPLIIVRNYLNLNDFVKLEFSSSFIKSLLAFMITLSTVI